MYGESYGVDAEAPCFSVNAGSSRVDIWEFPLGDESSIVSVRAGVVMGAFGLDKDGDIVFGLSLLAADLDESELREAVSAVKYYADHHDHEVQQRWGGQRFVDR
jgi:hypothetical protein